MQPLSQWKNNKYYIFWVCVYTLGIQHAMRMLYIVMCDLSESTIFFTSYKWHDFRKKVIERKMFVLISSTTFIWNIPHSKKNWAGYNEKYILVYLKSTRYSCHILLKLEFFRYIFEKFSNMKFHKSPSSGSQGVPCGRTDRQKGGRTDITKLTVTCRNFSNAPKKCLNALHTLIVLQIAPTL
jgi:hypothetical protein